MSSRGRLILWSLIAAGLILAARAIDSSGYSAVVAIAEVAAYVVAVTVCTALFERKLVREMIDYVRGRGGMAGMPALAGRGPEQPSGA